MKITSFEELISQSDFYGRCSATQEWEKVSKITEVVKIGKNGGRIGIKALDEQNRKLYNQVNKEGYEKLKQKFPKYFEEAI